MKISCLLLLLCATVSAESSRRENNDYLATLLRESRRLQLATSRQWLALLHYRTNLVFPGVTGQADDATFYLHPHGKTDPQAELDATLRAFFNPAIVETDDRQHSQCAYIARYQWLRHVLHFDARRLAGQPCKRFQNWRSALNPQALTLVFPSAYINNPSSMFGHTLLRVDAADQDDQTRLLAYAINYAVNPTDRNAVLFTVKSLIGAYPGLFSMSPYYIKVKEYSDLEDRDIWEYQLNFSTEEIERLLMHVWELGPVRFDYYFFDENCAYHLLSLLEVARPELDLTSRFRGWVIPVDTVRALVEVPGLVRRNVYRPAMGTRVRASVNKLDSGNKQRVLELATAEGRDVQTVLFDVPRHQQAVLTDTAYDFLRLRTAMGKAEKSASARRSRELLLARSRQFEPGPDAPSVPVVTPEFGHRTRRAAVSVGYEAGELLSEFRFRPAYHDLLDRTGGYAEGAQINFTDLALRYYWDSDRFRVEQLRAIDIVSLSPRDDFFRPVSWKFNIGLDTEWLGPRTRATVFRVNGGAGFTVRPWRDALLYGLVEGTMDVGSDLEDGVALGLGPGVGLVSELLPDWRISLGAHYQPYPVGSGDTEYGVTLNQSYAVSRNQALRLSFRFQHEHHADWTGFGIAWHRYF